LGAGFFFGRATGWYGDAQLIRTNKVEICARTTGVSFFLFNTITALSSWFPLTLAARFMAGVAAVLT